MNDLAEKSKNPKMPEIQHRPELFLDDPSQAHWLNILSSIEGMNIVKIGTSRIENIKSICLRNPQSITCIGENKGGQFGRVITYFETLENIRDKESFDIVIIDEEEFFYSLKSRSELLSKIGIIHRLLKEGGKVLICLPDRMRGLSYRIGFSKMLYKAGYEEIRKWICDPSCQMPLKIISFSNHPEWTIHYLLESYKFGKKLPIKAADLKIFIKRLSIFCLRSYNPFMGLIYVARKSAKKCSLPQASTSEQMLEKVLPQAIDNNIAVIYLTNKNYFKQFLFLQNTLNDQLLFIGKRFFQKYYPDKGPKQEFSNLLFVSLHHECWNKNGISVPAPVYLENGNPITEYVETAVRGNPLKLMVKRYLETSDKTTLTNCLSELTRIQILTQKELSRKPFQQVSIISDSYFENSTGISLNPWNHPGLIELSLNSIQHGDFTDGNILYDPQKNEWGIIDWEWLARGYPPLFDLFSLYQSVGFIDRPSDHLGEFERHSQTLSDSFFKINWFSKTLKELIQTYCEQFNIPLSHVFDCFIRCLLFYHNKYRIHTNRLDYQQMSLKLIVYAVQHQKEFILNQR